MNDARIDFLSELTCITRGTVKKIYMCLPQCPVSQLPARVTLVPRFTDDTVEIHSTESLLVTTPADRGPRRTCPPSLNTWDLTNILRKLLKDPSLTLVDSMCANIRLSNGRPYMQGGDDYSPSAEDLLEHS